MSTGKKVALTIAIIVVVVIIIAAVAIPLLINVDRYRPQVAAEIQQATGKPAQIGKLALTIFPQVAIRVDDFALENPAGFPSGDVVKAKKIYVVVQPGALLHHQVEIKSLELNDLTLNLLENTQGKWNFENPPASAANNNPPASGQGSSFTLGVISKVTVSNAQMSAASLLPSGAPGPALVDVHDANIDLNQVNLSAFTNTASLHREPAPRADTRAALRSWFNSVVYAADAQGPEVAHGTLKADSLQFGDLTVSKVSTDVRLYPKQVFADNLNLKCYSGTLNGNLTLNFGGANLDYGVDARLKGINVGELATAFPQARGMITGTLDGSAKLNGMVTHSTNPLEGITGSGQAAIHDGKLPSLRLNQSLRDLSKIAQLGPSNGDPSSFSSLSADFKIHDGKLDSDKIVLVGNGIDVDGAGSMSMAGAGTLDYKGDASLAAGGNNPMTSLVAGLSGGKYANGKVTFPFAVAGTFAQPKFSLKGVGASPNTPMGQVQQEVKSVRGLEGLFKKKK